MIKLLHSSIITIISYSVFHMCTDNIEWPSPRGSSSTVPVSSPTEHDHELELPSTAESSNRTPIGSPHTAASNPTESSQSGPTESSNTLDVSIGASVGLISAVVIITVMAIIILGIFFAVRKSKRGADHDPASAGAPYHEGSVALGHIATRDLQGRDNPVYFGQPSIN